MATPKKPFKPSSGHQITVGEAHQLLSTISAYGKVITGVTMDPSEAGTVHPQGKDEDLQLALVFGTSSQGKCVTLSPPQKVYMPAPDGPADGCGWDPAQYVVWKNLPLDWTTVHVQSQPKTLAMAFAPRDAAATKPSAMDVMSNDWLGGRPAGLKITDKLSDLWDSYGTGETYQNLGANQLAQCLSNAYSGWSWVDTKTAQGWTYVSDATSVL